MAACPTCAATLPADAPAGLCPLCLFAGGAAAMSGAETTPDGGSDELPDLAELAGLLPEYDFEGLIGRGGMGAVFKAKHRELGREVAVKVLPPASAESPEFAERFRREARALAALDHPNIVTLHDFGERAGCRYFVMEYVDGADLAERIRSRSITTDEALSVVAQVCDALDYSHGRGVVHRDIKPANILIDRGGRAKIADFGLAKLAGPAAVEFDLTRTDTAVGTPRYMAPEQMAGTPGADHRADLYALGVVFYELLTGEVPAGNFAPPSARAEGVGDHFDELVLRAMRDEPERRYQSAADLKASLGEALKLRRRAPGGRRELRRRFLLFRALPAAAASAGLAVLAILWSQRERDGGGAAAPQLGAEPGGELADWYRARRYGPATADGGEGEGAFIVNLDAAGRVRVEGDTRFGQGDVPPEAVGIVAVDAAEGRAGAHVLALRRDGRVLAWGDNTYGQCEVPEAAKSGIVAVAAGEFHSVALSSEGQVLAWGHNREGAVAVPPEIAGQRCRQIAAGARFTVALLESGEVRAWGSIGPPPPRARGAIEIGAEEDGAWALRPGGEEVRW